MIRLKGQQVTINVLGGEDIRVGPFQFDSLELRDGFAGEAPARDYSDLFKNVRLDFQMAPEDSKRFADHMAEIVARHRADSPGPQTTAEAYTFLKACGYDPIKDEVGEGEYIEIPMVHGLKLRARETHWTIYGRWARAYVEDNRVGRGFEWYLSDHAEVARDLALAGVHVALPAVEDGSGRDLLFDSGTAARFDGAALAELERAANLAWIAGKLPLPWARSTMAGSTYRLGAAAWAAAPDAAAQCRGGTPVKVIYIAGKYRGPNAWAVEQNIRAAEEVAARVWAAGHVALCPHANSRHMEGVASNDHILAGTLELMRRCDAVVLVPNWQDSAGARAEVAEAFRLGIEVIGLSRTAERDMIDLIMEDLNQWAKRTVVQT